MSNTSNTEPMLPTVEPSGGPLPTDAIQVASIELPPAGVDQGPGPGRSTRVAQLFAYMIERDRIRLRRAAGEPPPWTDDPVLRDNSFTNVRRSDDRTTRRLLTGFYGPNAPAARPGDVLFNCTIARFFGQADAVIEIGWQNAFEVDRVIEVARVLDSQHRLFTGAYVITNNGQRGSKVDFVCRHVLARLWPRRDRIAEAALSENGWQFLVGQLRQVPGLGGTGFMAKEVAQDFMLAMNWTPRDRDTFTPVGKGARRGLNRLHGRSVDHKTTSTSATDERRFLQEVRELFAIRHQHLPADFVELQLHDIQFNLCELDKYLRVAMGEGKAKRRFRPPLRSGAEIADGRRICCLCCPPYARARVTTIWQLTIVRGSLDGSRCNTRRSKPRRS
jgi:hypothetical protein